MLSVNWNAASESALVSWGYCKQSPWTGWLKQQTLIPHSLEAGNPRSGCQFVRLLVKAFFLLYQWPSCCLLVAAFSFKRTGIIYASSTLMT